MNAGIAYVLDYFRGIAEGFSQASMGQPGYTVGVFGSGYVLDSVYTADLADFKWLAAPAQWQGSAGYTTYDIVAYGIADTATYLSADANITALIWCWGPSRLRRSPPALPRRCTTGQPFRPA